MAYVIKGDVNVTGNITVQSKNVGTSITTTGNSTVYLADTSGHVDLPLPSKSDVDYILKQLPLSQYGALNNNAPGVAGTFDGGSTLAYYSAMPVLLEADGSLVYLRPGTNGSSVNYYYTYINNPNASMQPFTTINSYYTGSWKTILFHDSDAKTCLTFEEVGNNVLHLVLTNGTLTKANHQSATIARNLIPYTIMNSIVIGSYMYIVTLYSSVNDLNNPTGIYYNGNDPFEFVLYRIPVSQIQTGSVTTVEQISGITGNTLYGDSQGSQGYIRIADLWQSTIESGNKSWIRYSSALNGVAGYTYTIIGSVKCIFDGTNLIISMNNNTFVRNNSLRSDTRPAFRIFYNVSTKAFTTDLTTGSPLVATGGVSGNITWTHPYSVNSSNIFGNGTAVSDSLNGTWYITENGTQYYIREKYVLSDNYYVYSGKINNFTNKVDAYNVRGRTFNSVVQYNVYADYASRVGDQLMGGIPISTSRVLFSGTGTYEGTKYLKYSKGISDIGTTRTYTYNSFKRGTITGYGPQATRLPLPTATENATYGGVSYCDSSGNVTFFGTVFVEGSVLSAGYQLNPTTLLYDKTISISNTVLTNLKNSILSNQGLSPSSSTIALYYSPNTSYFASVACVTSLNSGGGGNMILASVNCTADTSSVLTATLNTVINNYSDASFISTSTNGTATSEMRRHGGLCVVNYSDFTYVSLPHLINVGVAGDSREYSYAGVKSGNTLTSLIMSNSYHAPDISPGSREYSYIPNYGFGYYVFQDTDQGTKLIFKRCGSTLSEFNSNMASGTGTDTVILAQDVPQGFYLYFTEVTPLFLSGQYFDVPITAIDLSTVQANPGNTTFYVYIKLALGTPSYVVSTTTLPETDTQMFLGTIVTDGTKVATLNIKKVSRLDTYRPSTTQIGSAFPVSTGNPTQTGTITW
ncbi:putative structural protein [Xanthomonas phage XbC2]|nr:putative structural protein [Xanthomonas phage XbC2]